MKDLCNYIKQVRQLTREMLALADEGDRDRLDDRCGILYGVLRDMAYRLRKQMDVDCREPCAAAGSLDRPGDRR